MQELRLVGIADDGEHLLLTGGGERFTLPLDEGLRAAVRRSLRVTTAGAAATRPETPLRPRDIQGLIRSGVPLEEIAERAGWPVDKVRRYEAPIRAERDYVCERARSVVLPSRTETVTLRERTASRLETRGVEAERVVWDSWKSDDAHWTVVVRFPAGGRLRQATWQFDPQNHVLRAVDDEARWLGGDELTPTAEDRETQSVPEAAPQRVAPADRPTPRATPRDAATSVPQSGAAPEVTRVETFNVGTTPPPLPSHPRPNPDLVEEENAGDGEESTGPVAQTPPQDEKKTAVPERASKSRSGRPSVPSWDDIMFGGRGPKS